MRLENLIHWRLVGTPDVFTEERDGHEWRVIHSGGAIHDAGFSQVVEFDRSIKTASLSCVAGLHTTGGGLMLRLGIQAKEKTSIDWSGWYGPDNGWPGEPAQILRHVVQGLNTTEVTVYLKSQCRYPARANTSRWRDVQLEVEYGGPGPDPEPDPDPDPDPDPGQGIAGQIAQVLSEITERIETIDTLLDEWGVGAAWVETYNRNKGLEG